MLTLGRYHTLTILRNTRSGLFLGDNEGNEVLLPGKFMPENFEIGQLLEVFIYLDSGDRPIATTQKAGATLRSFAPLRVKSLENQGAFLDWGLDKDLFVPYAEMYHPLRMGETYLFYVYLDARTGRLTASAKLDTFTENDTIALAEGEEVALRAWEPSELGWKVIINDTYHGLIYHSEIFRPLEVGATCPGYIQAIRSDGKIDVRLRPPGFAHIADESQRLLAILQAQSGFLTLHDKSPAEAIAESLHMSKKTFKKAVGILYKQGLLILEEEGIRLKQS